MKYQLVVLFCGSTGSFVGLPLPLIDYATYYFFFFVAIAIYLEHIR